MRQLFSLRSFLLAVFLCLPASLSFAGVAISINMAPPVLPVYTQPACPNDGYIWAPGYWAYAPAGYYWVPGTWVLPPRPGVLWTPGYWGVASGVYSWHSGYWGPHVGFYGGVNYGFGYPGTGFVGGAWRGNVFRYNTAVVNVNRTVVHNTYIDRTVVHNTTVVNRTSFNGPGGVRTQPTGYERTAMHEQHYQATPNQVAHDRAVNGRRYDQQQRVAQGVHNGQLTPHETAHVERREAQINHSVAADRRANDGHLTPHDRQNIEHRENHASREIHDDRHNDRAAPR